MLEVGHSLKKKFVPKMAKAEVRCPMGAPFCRCPGGGKPCPRKITKYKYHGKTCTKNLCACEKCLAPKKILIKKKFVPKMAKAEVRCPLGRPYCRCGDKKTAYKFHGKTCYRYSCKMCKRKVLKPKKMKMAKHVARKVGGYCSTPSGYRSCKCRKKRGLPCLKKKKITAKKAKNAGKKAGKSPSSKKLKKFKRKIMARAPKHIKVGGYCSTPGGYRSCKCRKKRGLPCLKKIKRKVLRPKKMKMAKAEVRCPL